MPQSETKVTRSETPLFPLSPSMLLRLLYEISDSLLLGMLHQSASASVHYRFWCGLTFPGFHPSSRALSSHRAVNFFWLSSESADFSLASSHVSIPELHLSASFWYWEASFLASSNFTSASCWASVASSSLCFSSSISCSVKLFSVSSPDARPLTPLNCLAQPEIIRVNHNRLKQPP
jgi:hypothetical protein